MREELALFLPKACAVLPPPQSNTGFLLCGSSLSGLFPVSSSLCPVLSFLKEDCPLSIQPHTTPVSFLFTEKRHLHLLCNCQLTANCLPPPLLHRATNEFFVAKSFSPVPSSFPLGNISHFVLLFKHCFLWLLQLQPSGGGERATGRPHSPHFSLLCPLSCLLCERLFLCLALPLEDRSLGKSHLDSVASQVIMSTYFLPVLHGDISCCWAPPHTCPAGTQTQHIPN